MSTCGEMLIRLLEEAGVDVVFGIPGVHTIELYRGLPESGIRHITPRHEQGAGFMADGYARVTGRPGVCLIITGPGMTNIMTAMGQAYADSIPMLVISSVNRREDLGKGQGRLHELPAQSDMVAGVSAFSYSLRSAEELPEVLARAFAVFNSARPRPVHIEIPLDIITAPAGHIKAHSAPAPSRPTPDMAAIEQAAKLLVAAKRPLVLLGGGTIDAATDALALVERLDAPCCCTINAKGILPKGHPLSLGSNQSLPPVRELALEADVVLAIGTELGETDYDVVFDGNFRLGGRLIRIDIDPEQLQRNFPAEIAINSDAGAAIRALLEKLGESEPLAATSPGAERVSKVRAELDEQWPPLWLAVDRLLETVKECLPEVIFVGDSTQPVYFGNHIYEPTHTRSWFNSTTGYGTLGYALPAAIGAKIASPDRPVVAIIGDGGVQFTLPELASAVEAGVPIIVLLWNNEGYGEIKRYMQNNGIGLTGVDIYTPDFQTLARGFGCHAKQATSFSQFRELLQTASQAKHPTLIEIREDASFLKATL